MLKARLAIGAGAGPAIAKALAGHGGDPMIGDPMIGGPMIGGRMIGDLARPGAAERLRRDISGDNGAKSITGTTIVGDGGISAG